MRTGGNEGRSVSIDHRGTTYFVCPNDCLKTTGTSLIPKMIVGWYLVLNGSHLDAFCVECGYQCTVGTRAYATEAIEA